MRFVSLLLCCCFSFSYAKERLVVLSPAINEMVYALGAGDMIVANTTHSTYPPDAKKKPKAGGYFDISIEKIISLKPTMVLMQKNNLSLKPKLQKLGIKSRLISLSSMDDIKKALEDISVIVSKESQAKRIVSDIEKAMRSLKGIIKDKKIMIVFGKYQNLKSGIYVSSDNLYFSDIIRASGNMNAVSSKSVRQPVLSYEGVVAANADIIYILAHDIKESRHREFVRSVWLKLPVTAAKKATVYVNDKKYASIPGPRVVLFIRDFKEILKDAASRFR